MQEREAIDRIKCTPIYRWTFEMNKTDQEPCELAKALQCAVNALEKQIPKKPEVKGDFMEGMMECPECGHHLGLNKWREEVGYLVKHCRECGQRLDWGE